MSHTVCQVLAHVNKLGECPRWDEQEQLLYWVDIERCQLHQFDPETNQHQYLQLEEEIGCFALRRSGGFVAALRSGFVLIDSMQGGITPLVDPEAHLSEQRFNDGRCDSAGRFIAGTMNADSRHQTGRLYSLDSHAVCQPVSGSPHAQIANGLAFSPDGKRMYWTDTPQRLIWLFDYDVATGAATNQRVFFDFSALPNLKGYPDGAAIDAEGCYWSALWDGACLIRINPQGELIAQVSLPLPCPTMPAFGGADLRTLYITCADGPLYSVRVDTPGLVEPRFA